MVGDYTPHLCPRTTPTPSRGIISPEPQLTVFMPREGAGVALRAQARHVVTYRGSPEWSLIYTVFAKKCQKRSKKGVPPILTTFGEEVTFLGEIGRAHV